MSPIERRGMAASPEFRRGAHTGTAACDRSIRDGQLDRRKETIRTVHRTALRNDRREAQHLPIDDEELGPCGLCSARFVTDEVESLAGVPVALDV
jgi:hypothetical protein